MTSPMALSSSAHPDRPRGYPPGTPPRCAWRAASLSPERDSAERWRRATVAGVETAARRLSYEEVLGLAVALAVPAVMLCVPR
jgi:hypothetical protein